MSGRNFPLLTQIDEDLGAQTIEWNENAFQTLLTSNLPRRTIFHYALDVGLRRLEQSLYETFWDATADALSDLTQFVFNENVDDEDRAYLHEGQCQLLMFAAVSMIKMNTIRRRSTHEAKMSCAAICSLLCQTTSTYLLDSTSDEFSSCRKSMFDRFLKRTFVTVQWLPTLSPNQLDDLRTNSERYVSALLEQLFPAVSLREKINALIDQRLWNNDDAASKDFVVIRRFPVANAELLATHFDRMKLGLMKLLDESRDNLSRKLIVLIWTLCCMIESDTLTFERELFDHLSSSICSEEELLLFLLLCAEQNVHLNGADSVLHPYHLYLSSHLCTQQQKNWWQIALETEANPPADFLAHLATIRLADERAHQHPPETILLHASRLIFVLARRRKNPTLRHFAELYFQTAKNKLAAGKDQSLNESLNKSLTTSQSNKIDKLFFFFAQKTFPNEENLLEQCEELLRETPPIEEEEEEEVDVSPVPSPATPQPLDSTLFATPPPPVAKKFCDVEIQTTPEEVPQPVEKEEKPTAFVSPTFDLIFNHMNKVNESIEQFCSHHQTIQADIHLIRDRLDQVNRLTSQMLFYS